MMTLDAPQLDDRTFQQIVDEARKRIPHYCPEWTDHNVSDPGIMLIELFSYMAEMLIYRMNQVPDLHYIKFMELFGVQRKPPQPASAPVTFWLSSPQTRWGAAQQSDNVVIPAGTEVSTTQTETQRPVVFATERAFALHAPKLATVGSVRQEQPDRFIEHSVLYESSHVNHDIPIFSARPQQGDALYFGFENDLSHHVLRLGFRVQELGGSGLNEKKPPWVWEVFTEAVRTESAGAAPAGTWVACEVDEANNDEVNNSLGGFNQSGYIQLFLPAMGEHTVHERQRFWLRVRLTAAQKGDEGTYGTSPRVHALTEVATVGCTVDASHAQLVHGEVLGVSNGLPGQRFHLQMTPLLPRQPDEQLCLRTEGKQAETWQEGADFVDKSAADRCYTLDSITGELRFGPTIRLPTGEIKQHGAVPPFGAELVMSRYRHGGGLTGNLEAGALNTLKTSIPYISHVQNQRRAAGGLDAQSLGELKLEMPHLLRTRQRAVTAEDFEFLVLHEFSGTVGRAKALATDPDGDGVVEVRIIPRVAQPHGFMAEEDLMASDQQCGEVQRFLDKRRLLTTRLRVRPAALTWVAAEVTVHVAPGADVPALRNLLWWRLHRFLNPLIGGFDGAGWPFGRPLRAWEVAQFLRDSDRVPGQEMETAPLRWIEELNVALYYARPGGEKSGDAVAEVEVTSDSAIASGKHHLGFTRS